MPRRVDDCDLPEVDVDLDDMPAPIVASDPAPAVPDGFAARKDPFSDAEDELIKETVGSSDDRPFSDWRSLAEKSPGRAGKQIRDRWVNYLNPVLCRSPFSRADDLMLKKAYEDLGSKWKDISDEYFQGIRSENQLKNRYHSSAFKKALSEEFPQDAAAANTAPADEKDGGDEGGSEERDKERRDEGNNESDGAQEASGPQAKKNAAEGESPAEAVLVHPLPENGRGEESQDESKNASEKVGESPEEENGDGGSSGEPKAPGDSAPTPSAAKGAGDEKPGGEDQPKPQAMDVDGEKPGEEEETKAQAMEVDGEKAGGEDEPKPSSTDVDGEKSGGEDEPNPQAMVLDGETVAKDGEEAGEEDGPKPPATEGDGEKVAKEGEAKPEPLSKDGGGDNTTKEDEPKPPVEVVDGERPDTEEQPMAKENEDNGTPREAKNQSKGTSTPLAKEVDGEQTDDEVGIVSVTKKRKENRDGTLKLPAKKKKGHDPQESDVMAAPTLINKPTQQLRTPFNQQIMNPQTANPQAMNSQQMMNQQIMNQQMAQMMMNPQVAQMMMMNPQMMMQFGQMGQIPPQVNPLPMVPPFLQTAQENTAAQQMMMMMGQQGAAATNSKPTPPVPQGNCSRVVLTLPQPPQKLGILLDDNPIFGMPELKSVAKNSPIRGQIPPSFQKDCCVVSLASQNIGHVEPKTARKCAMLISKAQEGSVKPAKLEVVLVRTKMSPVPPSSKRLPKKSPKKSKTQLTVVAEPPKLKEKGVRGRKSAKEKDLYDQMKRMTLLDFFADERKPTIIAFIRERNLPERVRSAMSRAIQSNKRLVELMDLRHVAERRKEAYGLIDLMLPDTSAEKAETDRAVRDEFLEFYSESKCGPLDRFCSKRGVALKVYETMKQTIDNDVNLMLLMSYRDDPDKRKQAIKIIRKLYPDNTQVKKKAEGQQKAALLGFFSHPSRDISLASFCEEAKLGLDMRGSMRRFIDEDHRLSQLVNLRTIEARREEAFKIIRRIPSRSDSFYSIPQQDPTSEKGTSTTDLAGPSVQVQAVHANEFFAPQNIRDIANKLDFETRPRMTRDGSKEIEAHDRKSPDEMLTLLILDLHNRVIRGRSISKREKDYVLLDCAHILFYDHGYKKVSGVSNLEKHWEKRLEDAYISGADTTPFYRNFQGSVSYTDRVEKDSPGLLAKLYEYTESVLGKDAPYVEKAMFMNEKSVDDAAEDPILPVLELNKTRLYAWVKQQKREGMDEPAQSKTEGDYLSFEKIEEKHPGMIDELYNFAIEAMGPDASPHILATCMRERSKEDAEENPTVPFVNMSKLTLPNWLKKRGEGL